MNRLVRCRRVGVVAVALLAGACQTLPEDAFRMPETALETRQIQTRQFEDVDEITILAASSGVLQDLGYNIDEVEKELGVLSASKRADATNENQLLGRIALDAFTCVFTFLIACDNENYLKADDVQDIKLTLVVLPQEEPDVHAVRVTMQRIVWDRDGRVSSRETIGDAEVYQAFFDKLSKSVFIEKEGV